jgi:hypothetical protein
LWFAECDYKPASSFSYVSVPPFSSAFSVRRATFTLGRCVRRKELQGRELQSISFSPGKWVSADGV